MSSEKTKTSHAFAAVVLAGGSGTRFWPRSRRARAKQVLQLDGERTMIQQTVARLDDVIQDHAVWVITNDLLYGTIAEQLRLWRKPTMGCEIIGVCHVDLICFCATLWQAGPLWQMVENGDEVDSDIYFGIYHPSLG